MQDKLLTTAPATSKEPASRDTTASRLFGCSSAVEQSAVNRSVVGSNPTTRAKTAMKSMNYGMVWGASKDRDPLGYRPYCRGGSTRRRRLSPASSLPPDYWTALALLAKASSRYFSATGCRVVIVGGAAISFYTQGAVLSGDFDLVADIDFERFLLAEDFRKDGGPGRFLGGYYHPDVPRLGFEFVSGALFDSRAEDDKLLAVFR